jgi:TRAP-type C4-dicarboxylate transport system substrate-binding protein
MAFAETYTSLQTHLIDGTDLTLATIESAKIYEVQKYLSLTNHNWSGLWLLVNGDFWKSLPPDLQAIVERNNDKYATLERADIQNIDASTAQKLATQGMAVNPVDPATFRAKLKPYYATWKKEFGATAWGLLETSIGAKLG